MPNRAFTATTSSQQALAYEKKRRALIVFNNGTDTVFISEDAGSVSTNGTPILPLNSFILHGNNANLAFWVQANTATQNLRIYEGVGFEAESLIAMLAGSATSRAQYYDRAIAERTASYNLNTVAPHANTQRWIYTVPANAKAFVDAGFVSINRDGVAATPGLAISRIVVTTALVTAANVVNAIINTGAVGTSSLQPLGGSIGMLAGATLEGYTVDASVDGTLSLRNNMHAIEFTA